MVKRSKIDDAGNDLEKLAALPMGNDDEEPRQQVVQTTVTAAASVELAKRVTAEGASVAAWVRRAIMLALDVPSVEAWVVDAEKAQASIPQDRPASHVLRQVERISPTATVYTLVHGPAHGYPGKLVTVGWLSSEHTLDHPWYASPEKFRFRLRGSSAPWRIVSTQLDATSQEMRIVLELDAGVRPEICRAIEQVLAGHSETLEKLAKGA